MKKTVKIGISDVKSFYSSLKYGSAYVRYEDEDARNLFLKHIFTVNKMFRDDILEEIPSVENVLVGSEYVKKPIEGEFQIIMFNRYINMPELKEDDLNLEKLAEEAKINCKKTELNISESLVKYAKKLAFRFGIKLIETRENVYCFDGSISSKSKRKLIEEAFLRGDKEIKFKIEDADLQTIRVYASLLSKKHNVKLKTSCKDGFIVIQMKSLELKDNIDSLVEDYYNKNGSIGISDLIDELKSKYLSVDFEEEEEF